MQKAKVRENVKEYALLTLGTVIMTLGIYFFKFPNHFSTGGVSGMAVILSHYIPNFTNGDFVMMINVLLLIVGYIVLGKGFGGRTTYVSLLMSGLTWGLERIIPMNAPMTSQPLMELIFAVSLPAVGSAILFNLDASSGGTDIVAMILRKYTSLNIGRALMCSDLIITLMACVAFGMETGLFCILGLVIRACWWTWCWKTSTRINTSTSLPPNRAKSSSILRTCSSAARPNCMAKARTRTRAARC